VVFTQGHDGGESLSNAGRPGRCRRVKRAYFHHLHPEEVRQLRPVHFEVRGRGGHDDDFQAVPHCLGPQMFDGAADGLITGGGQKHHRHLGKALAHGQSFGKESVPSAFSKALLGILGTGEDEPGHLF
jgi:hypothetical protein